ncbi:MAG: type IV pilus modification protein PilV [Magnetococcales bacterium]|nr:type IV pilus modification protein PilV [Magnetococcales bacterium]
MKSFFKSSDKRSNRWLNRRANQGGFSMMEVLITMLIVSVGLLGVSRLLARAHLAEMESYQRVQALILLTDIVDRLKINSVAVSCFAFTTGTTASTTPEVGTPYIGAVGPDSMALPTSCTASVAAYNTQAIDTINALDSLLKGAAESSGGVQAGAMIGARGCISYDSSSELLDGLGVAISGTGEYTVTVAWQGLSDTFAPTLNCGNDLYGDEKRRRVVSNTLRLANLD